MSYRPLVAGAALYSVGPAAVLLMPMIVGVYIDELGYSNRQAGILASVEAAGITAGSLLATFWVRRLNWRLVALFGLGCSAVWNLIATGVGDFTLMMLCRACASLAAGTAFAVAAATLGEQDKPETAFGVGLAVQTLLTTFMMSVSAGLIEGYGIDGLFSMLALLALVVALPAAWLPTRSGKIENVQTPVSRGFVSNRFFIIVTLIAIALHFSGTVGFWAFLERIGTAAGHSTGTIGASLAWALVAGMFGAMLATLLSDRWGFIGPFVISTVILIAATGIAVGNVSAALLATSAIAFQCMWVFANAYQSALVARLDREGRYVVLLPAAQGAGAMAGPALAAIFVQSDNYLPVNTITVSCLALSLVMFLLVVRRSIHASALQQ